MAASTTQLAVAGSNYSPFQAAFAAGAAEPSAGTYFAVPPFGKPPAEAQPMHRELEVEIPTQGVGHKRFHFLGRYINLEMIFIGANKAAVETAKNTFFNNITALAAFSVTVPGGTARSECRVKQPGTTVMGEWFTIGEMICFQVGVQLVQVRE